MGPTLSLTSSDKKIKKRYTAEHLRAAIEIDEEYPLDIALGLILSRDMGSTSRVDGFYITDLRSKDGTFLQPFAQASSFRLEPGMAYPLLQGDRIVLGEGVGAMEVVVRISQGSGLGADTGEGGRKVLMPPRLENFAPNTFLTAPQPARPKPFITRKFWTFLLRLIVRLVLHAEMLFVWAILSATMDIPLLPAFGRRHQASPVSYDMIVEVIGAPPPFTISTFPGVYDFPSGGQSRGWLAGSR